MLKIKFILPLVQRLGLGTYLFFQFVNHEPLYSTPAYVFKLFGLSAALLIFGKFCRINLLLCLIGWILLVQSIPGVYQVHDGFVGWLLLAMCLSSREVTFKSGWIVAGFSYTAGGLIKWESLSWKNGSALTHVLSGELSRFKWLSEMTEVNFYLSYLGLIFETVFVFLALIKPFRKTAWFSLTLIHIMILLTLKIPSITLAMLIFQLYLLDPKWLRKSHEA